ncbi:hypothetical protein E3Q08_03917 [Wallemia mellicola]|uniref:RRM domain-containing protein n=1 Tax=Wallemia mellicola TaxID=1708541 RepID=A0AB38MY73_9BASI|nr:hypothetical protein E3Q16_03878 [Wallemia mellicola]TIC20548.1 hypothetical protein E3Q12_03774 [Wallemia mellicola]TIC40104.1 hypothetical protein E3Q08_03917 [Wallemia mellicola]TIC59822.1 hypothetical protein E3Q03_03696 [Wallemia mellicola]TIC65568.1 hypothetical protein E3Q02_02121 [Wallemia mellicola]
MGTPNAQLLGSKIVFVGNLPYDINEEEVVRIFSEVGPVKDFRMNFDKHTGKPKGYGFVEYYDGDTAASAVRNLHDNPVGGRPLRVDLAPDDPKHVKQKEREKHHNNMSSGNYAPLPPPPTAARMGIDMAPGQSATDSISQTLASLPPNQLLDILSQMRASVHTESNSVRQLLNQNPQLSYALFQAMLMMNLCDNTVLQRLMPNQQAPQMMNPTPPPMMSTPAMYQQPPQPPMYPRTHTPTYAQPPPAQDPIQAKVQALPLDQQAMVMQVLSFTPQQIDALPPDQRMSIVALIATLATILAATTAVNAVPVQHESRQLADVLQGLIDQAGKANPTKDGSAAASAEEKDKTLDNSLDSKLKRDDAYDEGGRFDEALDQLKKRAVLNDYLGELLNLAQPGGLLRRQDDIEKKINETIADVIDKSVDDVAAKLPTKRDGTGVPIVTPLVEKLLGGLKESSKRQTDGVVEMLGEAPIVGDAVEQLLGKEEEEKPKSPLEKINQLNSRDYYKFWEPSGDSFLADVQRVDEAPHKSLEEFNHNGYHHKDHRKRQGEDAEATADSALDDDALSGLDKGLDALKKRQGEDAEATADSALDDDALSGLDKGLDALKKRQLSELKDAAGNLPVVGELLKQKNETDSDSSESSDPSLSDLIPMKARQLLPDVSDVGSLLEGGHPSDKSDGKADAKGLDKLRARLLDEEKPDPVGGIFDGLQGTVKEIGDTLPGNGGTAETFFERRADNDTTSDVEGLPNILKSLQTTEKTEDESSTTSSTPKPSSDSESKDPNILDDLTNTAAIKNGLTSAVEMIPE